VDLTDPILSRFDLLTVIRDDATEEVDERLATFVLNSHMKAHPKIRQLDKECSPYSDEEKAQIAQTMQDNLLPEPARQMTQPAIPQDLLKKYIMYAKRIVHPKLSEIDREKVTQFYADIRRESNVVGGIPIAVRHIESVLRMSEAFAKMHLRDYVRSEDIDFAISMLLTSFLQSQKESVRRVMSKKFQHYLRQDTEQWALLHHELNKLVNL
jgi:DNA replication licensing factor MCM2